MDEIAVVGNYEGCGSRTIENQIDVTVVRINLEEFHRVVYIY